MTDAEMIRETGNGKQETPTFLIGSYPVPMFLGRFPVPGGVVG